MPKLYSAHTIIKVLERNEEVAIGTFSSILKQAGITRKVFEKLAS